MRQSRFSRSGLLLASVAFTFSAVASSAAAADLLDPATGTRFESEPTIDDTDYRCLGAGVRRHQPTTNAYAVAYCVEAEQAEAIDDLVQLVYPERTGKSLESRLVGDQDFFDALSSVPGDKVVILHLVRDVPREALADTFRSSLAGVLPKAKVDKLVEAIPGDGQAGETALIHAHGAHVVLEIGGGSKSLDDDEISSKVWSTWLGPRSVSPSLKSSIAREAASEGGAATAAWEHELMTRGSRSPRVTSLEPSAR